MQQTLERFIDHWEPFGSETLDSYSIRIESASGSECRVLIKDILDLSEYFHSGPVSFTIDDNNDRYSISFDPNQGLIRCDHEVESEYDPGDLYGDDSLLVGHFEEVQNDTLSGVDDLIGLLYLSARSSNHEIVAQYVCQKTRIESSIGEREELQNTSIHFYFRENFFKNTFQNLPPECLRETFIHEEDSKVILLILDLDDFAYGPNLAIAGISRLDEFLQEFQDIDPTWRKSLNLILPHSLVIGGDDTYLPPDFFDLNEASTQPFLYNIREIFWPDITLFSLIAISTSAEKRADSEWFLRIRGKQVLSGNCRISRESDSVQFGQENGFDKSIELDNEVVDVVYQVYKWIYRSPEIENRIAVVRNVATLIARNLHEVLVNISDIQSSAQSNYRYYIEQSVDDFFEFRQSLMEQVFETQREFSNLRSRLMEDLSRDIFRTVGFIIALIVAIFFRLDEVVNLSTSYGIILLIVIGYISVAYRRVRGLHLQFRNLLRDRRNILEFYSKFFEENELGDMGLNLDAPAPWWCDLLTRGEQTQADIRCPILIDLSIYYLILASIFLLSIILIVDLFIWDFIVEFPISVWPN